MGFTIFTGKQVEKEHTLDMQNWVRHSQHEACASSGSGGLRSPQADGDPKPQKERCGHPHADSTNASPDTDKSFENIGFKVTPYTSQEMHSEEALLPKGVRSGRCRSPFRNSTLATTEARSPPCKTQQEASLFWCPL